MVNFLSRMAARAIGAAPVAQPFVPARYSPDSGLVRNHASGPVGPEPYIAAAESPAAPLPKTVTDPEVVIDATLPMPSESSGTRPMSRVLSQTLPAESVSAGTTTREDLDHRDRVLSAAATLPITQQAFSPVPTVAPRIAPEVLNPLVLDQPALTLREAEEPFVAPGRTDASQAMVPQGEQQPVRRSVPAVRTQQVMTPGARTPDSRRDGALGSGREAPIIRVSIGRIDVRAQFTAAPASPSPARHVRPPALSLDEYSKQRSEGKR